MQGGKKKLLKQKFRGCYMNGKHDMKGRGVSLTGCLLHFQTTSNDLVVFNLDLLISSIDNGSNYEGEVIANNVKSFIVDHNSKTWTLADNGKSRSLDLA